MTKDQIKALEVLVETAQRVVSIAQDGRSIPFHLAASIVRLDDAQSECFFVFQLPSDSAGAERG